MWGVTLPQALHPRPEETQGPRREEMETQKWPIVVIFRSGMAVFIVWSVEESGFVIIVTFLKIFWHGKMSRGWMAKEGHIGLWDKLEYFGYWRSSETIVSPKTNKNVYTFNNNCWSNLAFKRGKELFLLPPTLKPRRANKNAVRNMCRRRSV